MTTDTEHSGVNRARLWLKIDLGERGQIGPGKIALLKKIAEKGSIAAAARDLGMSYRRAWLLISALSKTMNTPAVETETGGREHGGARLTPSARHLIASYDRICHKADEAARADLETIS